MGTRKDPAHRDSTAQYERMQTTESYLRLLCAAENNLILTTTGLCSSDEGHHFLSCDSSPSSNQNPSTSLSFSPSHPPSLPPRFWITTSLTKAHVPRWLFRRPREVVRPVLRPPLRPLQALHQMTAAGQIVSAQDHPFRLAFSLRSSRCSCSSSDAVSGQGGWRLL